jgi:flagellar motility protein MotE (MotC chaperone)
MTDRLMVSVDDSKMSMAFRLKEIYQSVEDGEDIDHAVYKMVNTIEDNISFVKEKEQEQPQITKLTVDEVQASINDEKLYSKYIRNGQILNKLKIKVVDWGGYAEIEFKNLDDLIIASSMEGFTIKVVKVGYNTAGTVNYIEVTLE